LALDGSFSNDSTALIGIRLNDGLIDVMGLWERPLDDEHWRVDIEAVEERIRDVARTHTVREITADPFRWARSLQILAGEGLPITEFPQHAARMTPATSAFYDAVTTQRLKHSGDKRLARHIANASVKTDRHGTRLTKDKGGRKIDLAVAAVFGLARANAIIADDERPQAAVNFITL
jgi:phage terminase large subunit-like protein